MKKKFDLVIFDCDGVLVDSEYLTSKIGAELITKAGYEIAPEMLNENYAGYIFLDILKDIEQKSGIPLSANLIDQMYQQFNERMADELLAIDGVRTTIEKLNRPYCVCSNSNYQSIKKMLTHVGLFDLFEGKIFSAPEVGTKKPKPAPDVYLFAAQKMHASPENTVVIEDSVPGVRGASSAHMRVIGFTGGLHTYPGHADALTEAGAETVISRNSQLVAVIEAMEDWKDG